MISDATNDNNRLVLWDTVTNTYIKEKNDPLMSPVGLCKYQEQALISDCTKHCIYQLDTESWNLIVLLGKEGEEGFDDGPTASAKLCSPSGICVRGETIYICENPSQKQGE